MTTAVKIHVNGRYRATVKQDAIQTPEKGSHSTFEVTEEYVPDPTRGAVE
jgi:hypothetical protein